MNAAVDAQEVAKTAALFAPVARIYGEPLEHLPQDLYIPPDALEIILDAFEGPLDLLLYLIRKANVDMLDIPMAPLTRAVSRLRRERCARRTSNWRPNIC